MTVPRGLPLGTALFLALAWVPFLFAPSSGTTEPLVQSAVVVGLGVLTVVSRRWKVRVVRTAQRAVINPIVRLLLALGLNPLGLVLLETRGRSSGRARRTPVGDGRTDGALWLVAEHGERAHWVRNIRHDPHVRIRLRRGLRLVWVEGLATVLPHDDAVARQRRIVRWHPLRALNAVTVRVLGTDLLTVHVALDTGRACPTVPAAAAVEAHRPVPA